MAGEILGVDALTANREVHCDVCIVGSGAGGGFLAAGLAARGLDVVVVEEGSHFTQADFDLTERNAYPALYQDGGSRTTSDLAITVLQGRSVGGSTTVNWTTCFRTPERILEHWERTHGVEGLDIASLRPHFEAVEARLGIVPWSEDLVNPNNRKLLDGARALGWHTEILSRNVRGCVNSGYCGMGCPLDAKQAMAITTLADAVRDGATIYANTRAVRFELDGDRVTAVRGMVLRDPPGVPTGIEITVRPKVAVSCAGAINSPMLLLRSGIERGGLVGQRTFLHPVVAVLGEYAERVDGWYGAPQSVHSHEFVDRGPDHVGVLLEASPVHPMLAASALRVFGSDAAQLLGGLSHASALISLAVDGLLPGDQGGTVALRSDGRLRLDYPISAPLAEAFRFGMDVLAQIHLAAGSERVFTLHPEPVILRQLGDLPLLASATYGAHQHTVFSAHQMGGCAVGPDPSTSVVDLSFRVHDMLNLFVVDGSVLPTALGVNPSETIYALAHWATDHVASAV